jgi:lysophospholipase L1-like esterase
MQRTILGPVSGLALCLLASMACAPSDPPGPAPTPTTVPTPTGAVVVSLFYDEDGDGHLGSEEHVRVPNATVVIGPCTARTLPGTGIALVQGIPFGVQSVAVQTESLPPYWLPAPLTVVSVPEQGEVRIPMTLAAGDDRVANQYVAFGDSITRGQGSSTKEGYPPVLESTLRTTLGAAWVANRGEDGSFSSDGAKRVKTPLKHLKPGHVLILYGTNDWNSPECQVAPAAACYTIDQLRLIIETVKDWGSLAVLATLPPVSVNTGRNVWIEEMNVLIKALGREQAVPVVDSYAAFRQAAVLQTLFADDVHPNDAGYQVLAQAFARVLTNGRGATQASHAFAFGLVDPSGGL